MCNVDGNNLVVANLQNRGEPVLNLFPNNSVIGSESMHCKVTEIPQKRPKAIVRIDSSKDVALRWPQVHPILKLSDFPASGDRVKIAVHVP